jgi:hypothetical protein
VHVTAAGGSTDGGADDAVGAKLRALGYVE